MYVTRHVTRHDTLGPNKCGICKTNNCHNKHRTFYNRALNFVPLFSPQFPVFSLIERQDTPECMMLMLFSEEKSKCSSLENKYDFYITCNIPNPNFPDG